MKVHSVFDVVLDKRERILAAAARLIVRNGLQCSMAAIAEEASVATRLALQLLRLQGSAGAGGLYARHGIDDREPRDPSGADSGEEPVRRYIESYIDFILGGSRPGAAVRLSRQ
ncbi:hypothetical protein [Devosia ginsengisoli]|uniref:hypothetical protein n=1 Tax=Devosia ginsengisoli TaxID=400770 RepID=UPI0026EA409B|nr:hypothetical protein [Devosia ginsengisoli]MCR6673987.1 hypothetical protein [Devosia ginsengisoli]